MDQKTYSDIDARCDESLISCYKDIPGARKMAEESLDLSENIEYGKGVMNARIILCSMEIFSGNMDLAREKIGLIEENLVSHASPDECLMRLFYIRGLYFLKERNLKDAFDAFFRSGLLASRLGQELYKGLSENGKGNIKYEEEEYDDAYDYYTSASEILSSLNHSILNSVVSFNLGASLFGAGHTEKSESILRRLQEQVSQENWYLLDCSILDQLGQIMLKQEKLDDALIFFNQGVEKSRNIYNKEVISSLVYGKARILILQGEILQAEDILQEFATQNSRLEHKSLYYKLRAEILELKGLYRDSLKFYKLFLREKKKSIGYDVSRSILQQENRQLKEVAHQQRLISTIGQELVANLDIGLILNLIYAQMNVLMPVNMLVVALVEGDFINVKFALRHGQRFNPVKISIQEPNSLLAWAVRNRKEVFVRNFMEDGSQYIESPMGFKEDHEDYKMHSVLCIPLWYIDEVVGGISVQAEQMNAYTNRDLENLRALGAYAGIAIRNALQTEKINEMNEVLKKQSSVDSLTGLVNRREMAIQARNIWRVCRRNHFWISLVMIDLDHFKIINDTHGHAVGDVVLKKVGSRVRHFFKRALDSACRYGGEELMIITGEMSPSQAAQRVEELREDLASLWFEGKNGQTFQVGFSCGIYGEVPVQDVNIRFARLTNLVDSYLYKAKENGRNCTYLSDDFKKPPEKFRS